MYVLRWSADVIQERLSDHSEGVSMIDAAKRSAMLLYRCVSRSRIMCISDLFYNNFSPLSREIVKIQFIFQLIYKFCLEKNADMVYNNMG